MQSPLAWQLLKIQWAGWVCTVMLFLLFRLKDIPFPTGICAWFNCTLLMSAAAKYALATVVVALGVLYLTKKFEGAAAVGLCAAGLFIFSLEESNGYRDENGLYSLIFLVQAIAYFLFRNKNETAWKYYRLQFSAQLIAAVYVLSALSKLKAAGVGWFGEQAVYFPLQIVRRYYCEYAGTGNLFFAERGMYLAQWCMQHLALTRSLLAGGLLLEFFAVVLLLQTPWRLAYAFGLIVFHVVITFLLGIFYSNVLLPLLIVFFNPLFFVWAMTGEKNITVEQKVESPPAKKYFLQVVFFISYVVMSWVLPKTHPFSKFEMFNFFPSSAYAFVIKDQNGKTIAAEEATTISGNQLYEIHAALLAKYKLSDAGLAQDSAASAQVAKQMWQSIYAARKNNLLPDSFNLNKVIFTVHENEISSTETKMYGAKQP